MGSLLYLIHDGRRRRQVALGFTLCSATALFVFFQNFSSIPIENLKLKTNRAEARVLLARGTDIRDIAPARPEVAPTIAIPTSGDDLESVGKDWLQKQGQILTGGAEKKLLRDVNKRMNRWVGSAFDSDSEDTDAQATQAAHPTAVYPNTGRAPANLEDEDESPNALAPTKFGFSRINRFEMGWSNQLKLSCDYGPGSMRVDLKQPISENFDVNLSHESNTQSNSFRINYRW